MHAQPSGDRAAEVKPVANDPSFVPYVAQSDPAALTAVAAPSGLDDGDRERKADAAASRPRATHSEDKIQDENEPKEWQMSLEPARELRAKELHVKHPLPKVRTFYKQQYELIENLIAWKENKDKGGVESEGAEVPVLVLCVNS